MAKQIVISRAGKPEVLVDRELEPRAVGAGEVRIEVAAAGVNFADVVGRLGNYPDAPPIPYCPGYEVSGTVTELGTGADGLALGQRVCALVRFGGYAEEVVTRADGVFPLPEGVETVAAAAVPVTYLTADVCLFEAGGARAGHTVLVLGGAGGVGSAALQLLRGTGIRVLATAGSAAKCDWMREQGVDRAINYNEEDVAAAVAEATGGQGVDVVLDPIGGRGIHRSIAMCRPLGRVVLFGASSTNPSKKKSLRAMIREGVPMRFFNLVSVFGHNVGIHPINMLHLAEARPELAREKMARILERIAAGELAPVIAQRLPLDAEGARAAHNYLQDRKNIGKVVLARELATVGAAVEGAAR